MYKKAFCMLLLLCTSAFCHQNAPIFDANDFYADYKKIIADIYQDVDAVIPEQERQGIKTNGGSPVYGEILFDSVNSLLSKLQLTKDDVFYDLGSGLGKFVLQVYLMTPVKKSVGIEFSVSRYQRAQSAALHVPKIYNDTFKFENSMRKNFGKPSLPKVKGKAFEYINGCILQEDFSDATVVFTCSTCFDEDFLQKMVNKFAAIDDLRIVSLKALPYHKHLHLVATHTLAMTWSSDVAVYMYEIDRSKVAANPHDETENVIFLQH